MVCRFHYRESIKMEKVSLQRGSHPSGKSLRYVRYFWGMGSLRILPLNIVTVVFDELGLTDNKNPFGLISFLHPFLDLLSAGK